MSHQDLVNLKAGSDYNQLFEIAKVIVEHGKTNSHLRAGARKRSFLLATLAYRGKKLREIPASDFSIRGLGGSFRRKIYSPVSFNQSGDMFAGKQRAVCHENLCERIPANP